MTSPRQSAFTLMEIMIVVAIIGLLAAIAIPNYVKARSRSQTQICVENLFQIESAKQRWGVEVGKTDGDLPTASDLFGINAYIRVSPVCPAGGNYTISPIGTSASCDVSGHEL